MLSEVSTIMAVIKACSSQIARSFLFKNSPIVS